MRCQICGKEFSYHEGEDTILGFVCRDCYNARDFKICVECGRKFPRDEMIEWNGFFYCKTDYFKAKERYERIREEEKKKKEEEERKKQPPLIKSGKGIGIPIKRKNESLEREEMKSLIKNLNERKENKKEVKKESVYSHEADVLLSILNSISSETANLTDDLLIKPLGDMSISKNSKEKRKDAIKETLKELHELIRQKRRKK